MIQVGTSGYNYEAWRGSFYPEDLSARKMLSYYAERFSTVEINYSFYRKPTAKILQGWAAQVPPAFHFALKAWQRITHQKRLRDCSELVTSFAEAARTLGPRLGPVLYQLPPNLKADVPLLREFLLQLPRDLRAAFEFRHASWFSEETYAALRDAKAGASRARLPGGCVRLLQARGRSAWPGLREAVSAAGGFLTFTVETLLR